MITHTLSMSIHDGKLVDAFSWAAKVAGHINRQFPGSNVQVVRNVGGSMFELHFVSVAESLAAYEALNKQVEADEGYQKLLNEGREQRLIIGASVNARLYETVT